MIFPGCEVGCADPYSRCWGVNVNIVSVFVVV